MIETDDFSFEESARMVSPEYSGIDADSEISLRPKSLDEYIGQEKAKENLKIYITAALQRNEALDHVLLYGPPGLGKTTLSGIIAKEMGVNLRITSGPAKIVPHKCRFRKFREEKRYLTRKLVVRNIEVLD